MGNSSLLERAARYMGRRILPLRSEGLLLTVLQGFYRKKRRVLAHQSLPYFDQRIPFFEWGFDDIGVGCGPFVRGLSALEILRPQDEVLDLGCGEGFLAARFYAPFCTSVDGVDCDERALTEASRSYRANKTQFHRLDFLKDPFPKNRYDVVVFNAAFGTFDDRLVSDLFQRSAKALEPVGVFAGSRALAEDTTRPDTLESLEALSRALGQHFRHVFTREIKYWIVGRERREILWRCSNDLSRLEIPIWNERSTS